MPDKHSILSASASKRWLNCPPSVRLEEKFPEQTSVYAEEGTWAHELCEYKVRKYLKERVQRPQSEFLTEEIDKITDVYQDFIISIVEQMKQEGISPLVMVEERLDYSHIAPTGFGTGDCIIIGNGEMHVIDFKTGAGVFVEADHNSQMMLYALGALHAFDYIYDVNTVHMTIVQPRKDNISTFTMTAEELKAWGESIKPIAKLAFEGKGEQKPGEWCRFCKAKAVCRACADEALELVAEPFVDLDAGVLSEEETKETSAESTDITAPYLPDTEAPVFKSPGLISQSDIEVILPKLNRIQSWIESVFAYVSAEAISHGVSWKGYKVVEGRSKRVFSDEKAVADAAEKAGYTDIYKKSLITLTEFEKMMGKKKFNQLLGDYIIKPPGKLTLVPEDDPREAVDLSDMNTADDMPVMPFEPIED